MIESTGSMGRTATYAEELLVAEVTRLRGELSLAEEGLANYAQENAELRRCLDGGVDCAEEKLRLHHEVEQLRALLTQAPVAKVTVRESFGGDVLDWAICTPGLPPGEHDLYLMPSVNDPSDV